MARDTKRPLTAALFHPKESIQALHHSGQHSKGFTALSTCKQQNKKHNIATHHSHTSSSPSKTEDPQLAQTLWHNASRSGGSTSNTFHSLTTPGRPGEHSKEDKTVHHTAAAAPLHTAAQVQPNSLTLTQDTHCPMTSQRPEPIGSNHMSSIQSTGKLKQNLTGITLSQDTKIQTPITDPHCKVPPVFRTNQRLASLFRSRLAGTL